MPIRLVRVANAELLLDAQALLGLASSSGERPILISGISIRATNKLLNDSEPIVAQPEVALCLIPLCPTLQPCGGSSNLLLVVGKQAYSDTIATSNPRRSLNSPSGHTDENYTSDILNILI